MSNPLNSSELRDKFYEVVTRLFAYGVDWTEYRDKNSDDHDVSTYAAKIKADFAKEVTNELVQIATQLIAKHTQEARIDIEDYIKLLPANWYRGEFILTYDRNADKWVAGYGNASATSVLPTGVADSPLEAIKMLYEYLVKDGKITDSLATLKPKTGGQ